MRIHTAESVEAPAMSHNHGKHALFSRASSPEDPDADEGDSRKNAAVASMASRDPNTSPTKAEYLDQFVPNWKLQGDSRHNSRAKLIRNSFPQNRSSFKYVSSP